MTGSSRPDLRIFSTCPQSKDLGRDAYATAVADVARWSEEAGCEGILVYTDNGIADPWLVANLVIQSTERLAPLVAVQSAYMHPYTAAKTVATLGLLEGRRVYLNMVAGGFRNDLLALGDETPHDERYRRTVEYGKIMLGLLRGEAVTLDGEHYDVKALRLAPELPPELMPGMTISGSSDAGLAAARELGATPIKYPKPPGEEEPVVEEGLEVGCRVGIVAREDDEQAWRVALERFPEDRKGQLAHQMAMKVSDSEWHRQLAQREPGSGEQRSPYWLGPFQNYKTFCPYLVGSYERVGAELAAYVRRGFTTFILDIPPSAEELGHISRAFDAADAAR